MKKINQLLLFGTALLCLSFLQSCNDDDDSDNDPPSITYPHTITFSHFENVDFKMWTNGAEVNTDGLNFLDFVNDAEDLSELSEETYTSSSGLTFTEDSVFSISDEGLIEAYPYVVSNDSVYVKIDGFFGSDTIVDVFIGLGSPTHLKLVQGFAQYCNASTFGSLTIIDYESFLQQEFQTFESASEHWGISSLQTLEEGDTLLINNRYVHID